MPYQYTLKIVYTKLISGQRLPPASRQAKISKYFSVKGLCIGTYDIVQEIVSPKSGFVIHRHYIVVWPIKPIMGMACSHIFSVLDDVT